MTERFSCLGRSQGNTRGWLQYHSPPIFHLGGMTSLQGVMVGKLVKIRVKGSAKKVAFSKFTGISWVQLGNSARFTSTLGHFVT